MPPRRVCVRWRTHPVARPRNDTDAIRSIEFVSTGVRGEDRSGFRVLPCPRERDESEGNVRSTDFHRLMFQRREDFAAVLFSDVQELDADFVRLGLLFLDVDGPSREWDRVIVDLN